MSLCVKKGKVFVQKISLAVKMSYNPRAKYEKYSDT